MDVADHFRLGEGEEVAVVQEVFGGVFEAVGTDIGLGHAVGADSGAHGAVDDGDPVFEDGFEGGGEWPLFMSSSIRRGRTPR